VTVSILLPLELATGFLLKSATWLAAQVPAADGKFNSPIKSAVKWLSDQIVTVVDNGLNIIGLGGAGAAPAPNVWLAIALAVIGFGFIVVTLIFITKNMKRLMANRIEELLNRVLQKSGWIGLAIGIVITIFVQSSSITTSLLIPMFGAGLLRVENGFPIMIGANIGTTVTALLAASVTGPAGLTIALVHLLFNLCGTLIFFPVKPMRRIPVWLGERMADLAAQNRLLVIVYIAVLFVVIPILGIWLF